MATKNDDASSSADSSDSVLENLHLGILDENRVRDMKRKASLNYYDWPIEKKGSKAAKRKRSTSNDECATCSELLALQGLLLIERASRRNQTNRLRDEIDTLRDEVDTLRAEADKLRNEATRREMEYQHEQLVNYVHSYK